MIEIDRGAKNLQLYNGDNIFDTVNHVHSQVSCSCSTAADEVDSCRRRTWLRSLPREKNTLISRQTHLDTLNGVLPWRRADSRYTNQNSMEIRPRSDELLLLYTHARTRKMGREVRMESCDESTPTRNSEEAKH